MITVHAESTKHLHRVIQQIKSYGIKAGVSLNPTSDESIRLSIIDDIDMVLVKEVSHPGLEDKIYSKCYRKNKKIKAMRPDIDIQVDGGITDETIRAC